MYRIMLADDEGLELNSLKFIIEKNFGSSCEIEMTKTGRGAIELAESFRPDIAVMDIQMPGINGIDAMREIRKRHSEVRFIVLTAYDNFDYAKESISVGVSDYLTKPVRREVMVQALETAMGAIDTERSRRSSNLELREKLETAMPMLEAGFIYAVLLRQSWRSGVQTYAELLDIRQGNGYCLVLELENSQQQPVTVRAVSDYDKIHALLKEMYRGCVISSLMGNRIIMAVFCDKPEDEYETRLRIMERVRQLKDRIGVAVDLRFRVGVGAILPLPELAESYQQAVAALAQRKVDDIAHFNDLPLSKTWEQGYPTELEYGLYDAIEHGSIEQATQLAGRFFDWMAVNHSDHMMDVRLKVLEMVMRSEYIAFHTGGSEYHFLERHGYMETVLSLATMEGLRSWYLNKINAAVGSIDRSKEEQNLSTVAQAEQYIRSHYSSDLTLNDVSKAAHISPYYFSKLFKDETGENFIEYLTRIRMEQAKRLLTGTAMSVKEICREVGYSDPNYFSRSFRKYAGASPRDYREQAGGGL